jgi:hypothetical protein
MTTNFDPANDIDRASCDCEVIEIVPEYIEIFGVHDIPEGTLNFLVQWVPSFPSGPV